MEKTRKKIMLGRMNRYAGMFLRKARKIEEMRTGPVGARFWVVADRTDLSTCCLYITISSSTSEISPGSINSGVSTAKVICRASTFAVHYSKQYF